MSEQATPWLQRSSLWSRLTATAVALLVMLGSLSARSPLAAQSPQPAEALSASALAQIQALLTEKASRTPAQQKIDSQLIYEMSRRKSRCGMVTMCIGGGMGAAAIFENLQ